VAAQCLTRFALNLNHLTLPEIKDFNALGESRCLKSNAKRSSWRNRMPDRV
jgi:hypothetical protein